MNSATQTITPVAVLLVEDNVDDAELVSEALKGTEMRYNLTVLEDGVEALAYLRREGKYRDVMLPDLILLDLNLPRKDGRQVLAEVKSDETLKRIPVVVLTSSQAEQDILSAYDNQANCYLAKPFNLNQLLDMAKTIESWVKVIKLPKSQF